MKITFIGTGSAFAKRNFNSSAILETTPKVTGMTDGGATAVTSVKRLMIDCGRTAPEAIAALGLKWHDIDVLYVSHAHSDHAGGIEEYAFMRMFVPPKSKPSIFGDREMLHDLWDHTLKGGLGAGTARRMYFEDYFNVNYADGEFEYGGVKFATVKLPHIMPSYGLAWSGPNKKAFYSSDCTFDLNTLLPIYRGADIIFQDCEAAPYKSGVHAHFSELATLPADIKAKMWLYHYQDVALPDAKAVGFAGFVAQGQSFDL